MAGEVFSESKPHCMTQLCGEKRSSNPLGIEQMVTSVLDQELSPVVESSLCTTSTFGSAPICRQFWKAGNYDSTHSSKLNLPKGTGHLSVHPKFLHSNATSHKWPFGAIAELVDNAIDEVHNGATFAVVDKILNPRDGSPALLVQDDGGGMDPTAMLHCLSFGFSDKNSKVAIGQYGNGFKTSTMRLGSDVIVFSRHIKNRRKTRSIGLLSYTFLMQTGHDRIVVPMVDYELNAETNRWTSLNSAHHDSINLSLFLQWSPYSSEENLLKQFDDIGSHGTKIVIYNLWHTNDDKTELDFESDPQDICVSGAEESKGMAATELQLANRLRTSLRAYLSILYLRIPENFCILLRGKEITHYKIASDLRYPECILYRPHTGVGFQKAEIFTTIGFLKEAPHVNVHGFNIYHKNRLILPFWPVISSGTRTRGRGVVGVLEANFIQPTHNKQDFEKTPAFQKLEHRLTDMTYEYWNLHCGLLGYQAKKKPKITGSKAQPDFSKSRVSSQPVISITSTEPLPDTELSEASSAESVPTNLLPNESKSGPVKRKVHCTLLEPEVMKKKAGTVDRNVHCSSLEAELVKEKAGTVNRKVQCSSLEPEVMKKKAGTVNSSLELELVKEKARTINRKVHCSSLEPEVMKRKAGTVNSNVHCSSLEPELMKDKAGTVNRKVHCSSLEPEVVKKKAGTVNSNVHCSSLEPELVKEKAGSEVNVTKSNQEVNPANDAANELNDERLSSSIEENKKLHAKWLEHERIVKRLNLKVVHLKIEIEEAQEKYDSLLAESKPEQAF